ncbi:hypothetical protein Taro_048384 [Colocasia esculenta]|uniref:Uncharacterized protein n=1 Tax=Colocasia esculenta TaxID=4460 RepID=A0A843WY17_COLES|nr:hypothetical protein [Colocasia esculenta]
MRERHFVKQREILIVTVAQHQSRVFPVERWSKSRKKCVENGSVVPRVLEGRGKTVGCWQSGKRHNRPLAMLCTQARWFGVITR